MLRNVSFSLSLVLLMMIAPVQAFEFNLPWFGETGFYVTETAVYRHFTDSSYVEHFEQGEDSEFINRLNLLVTHANYTIGLRGDVDINTVHTEEYRLEKKFIHYSSEKFNYDLGDYYVSMGRGLVLNVLKLFEDEGVEYQLDQSILGARFGYTGEKFTATVLGGYLEDDITEIKDSLVGGSLTWHSDVIELGTNVASLNLDDTADRERFTDMKNETVGSLSIALPDIASWGSFYLEYAGSWMTPESDAEDIQKGWAIYSESSFIYNNFTMLLEAKRYKEFYSPYHSPPLLEPEELSVLAEQFVLDTGDITGVRLKVDYSLPDSQTVLYVVSSYLDNSPEDDMLYGTYRQFVSENYMGFESYLPSNVVLLGAMGYRYDNSSEFSPSEFKGYTPHAFFSVVTPLTERQSLELIARWKRFDEDAAVGSSDFHFTRSELDISYHFSQIISLTGTYEHDDNPSSSLGLSTSRTDYYSLSMNLQPVQPLYLKVFYGATPGGVKCASGVCKTFPPFEGLRLGVVLRM